MIITPYLIVKDMEKSCAFYSAFFGEEPDNYCPGRFVVFDAGNTKMSLYNPQYDYELFNSGTDLNGKFNEAYIAAKNKPVRYGNNVVLNIGVDDLKSEYERLKKLDIGEMSELVYINIAAPYWCFWLSDPDGNQIEVTGRYDANE